MPTLPPSSPRPAGYADVNPADAWAHRDAFVWIDVREPDELTSALGKAAGVLNVPLATIPLRHTEFDKSKPTLLVCRSGGRSGQAASWLAANGWPSVYNLAGGMLAWNDLGLPKA